MSRFTISLKQLVRDLLPPTQRTRPTEEILRSLLEPLGVYFQESDPDITDLKTRALYSGQAIKVRQALQDITGISEITVTLARFSTVEALYLVSEGTEFETFTEAEGTEKFINTQGEGAPIVHAYDIGVPAASYSSAVVDQITAEINDWGLPMNNFSIVSYLSLTEGLLNYYNFNESSGDLLDKVSGNDGTITGAIQNGDNYTFDGLNDQVALSSTITLSGDFTLSFWVDPHTLSGDRQIVGRTNQGLYFDLATLYLRWWLGAAPSRDWIFSPGLNTSRQMITLVRESGIIRAYRNGTDEATNTVSYSSNILFDFIGRGQTFFDGEIEDLGVWNRAITADERSNLYNGGTGLTIIE